MDSRSLELWESSAEAWRAFMVRGDRNRELLLDDRMRSACGDVCGRRALDVGSGDGRFSRFLEAMGATAVELEPTRGLIEGSPGRFRVRGSATATPFVDASFDVVVAYLVLIDVDDHVAAIRESARVLRPGGRMVVANLNGFVTSREDPWHRDAEGKRMHIALGDYATERPTEVAWAGIRIVNWHRPLASYMRAFLDAGFRLIDFQEPTFSDDALVIDRDALYESRVPWFNVMVWDKS